MIIENEEELIEFIKNKNLNEIKNIFEKNQFNFKKLNYLQNILLFLINENVSIYIIKYILEQQQQSIKQKQQENEIKEEKKRPEQQQNINNIELLFYSIKCNNFKVAKLLLSTRGVKIENKNTDSKNVIEYLIEKKELDTKKKNIIYFEC